MDSPLALSQQKLALERAEAALKNQKHWLQKREEIEKAIMQLEKEMEHDVYQKHFHSTLENKRRHLHQLKQEQRQIDRLLDQWEDLNEEVLHQQRTQLLYALWQLHPENKEEQEAKWKEWNHLQILEVKLLGIEKGLERLSDHLNFAIQTRQSIRGRGLLNYIFGTSPNFVIEKQLLAIQAVIEALLPLTEQTLNQTSPTPLHLLLQHLSSWLLKLHTTCRKSWSFSHLDAIFAKTTPTLKQFLDSLRQQQYQLIEKTQKLNKEMDNWIKEL